MVSGVLAALRRLSIVIAIAIVFVFGLATTVYLSLRSPEVTVPDVLGKDRFEAESILGDAGLNFRIRDTRPNSELKADTVLFQLPRAGEVVKVGQTVAMDISRTARDGESSAIVEPEKKPEEKAVEKAGNRNGNEATANENRAKRNKNTNKNANENANTGNANGNANSKNRNANANANRPPTNKNANAGNTNTIPNVNSGRPAMTNNSNRGGNQNENRRPVVSRPSPANRPNR